MPVMRATDPVYICEDCYDAVKKSNPKMPANYGQPRGDYRYRTSLRRNVPVTHRECNCKRRQELLQQFLAENEPKPRVCNKRRVKATHNLNTNLKFEPFGAMKYIEFSEAMVREHGETLA
jgi:hypothetical protein